MWKALKIKKEKKILHAKIILPETRNAISYDLIDDIKRLKRVIDKDDLISVLILTGSEGVFSSGGNINELYAAKGMFSGDESTLAAKYRQGIQQIPLTLYDIEIPIIAAINGPAIGAGLDLAMMCDIRWCSSNAFFAENFTRIGLISGDGGYWFLMRVLGHAKAMELALTGRKVTAIEAKELGIVSEIVAEKDLFAKTLELAKRIADNPKAALISAKKILRDCLHQPLSEHLNIVAGIQANLHHAQSHKQAIEKFMQQRQNFSVLKID